jgi:hypothetical protein
VFAIRAEGFGAGPWRCRIDLRLETRGDSLRSSLAAIRLIRPIGGLGSIELRSAIAADGAFWVGRPQALAGVRPVRLRGGEHIMTVRFARGPFAAFASERGLGREHRLECGVAYRWPIRSEEES